MSKISIVKGVEVSSHDAYGDLMFVSYKYNAESLEKGCYMQDNRGLVVFFKHTHNLQDGSIVAIENAIPTWEYLKSFVLSRNEVENILHRQVDIVRDLGYILCFRVNSCEILNLGSYAIHDTREDKYTVTNTYGQTYFEIYNRKAIEDAFVKDNNVGMQLAIKVALNQPIETDFLVSGRVPSYEFINNAHVQDFSLGGNR